VGLPILLHTEQTEGAAVVVGLAGAIVGPSAGHFYAQDAQAWWGIGIRVGSAGVFAGSAAWALNETDWFGDGDEGSQAIPGLLAIGSALTFFASGLYDIVTAPRSAHEYNKRHGQTVSVRPTYVPGTGAGLTVRVQL
jgi:hypothetical protein